MTGSKQMPNYEDVSQIAPALAAYTQNRLFGDVWKRPGLASRDRSIATLAALIARNQTIELAYYFNLALDNGVKPREISEIITHLAFYASWGNAMSAVAIAKDVFASRHIGADQLPAVKVTPLPLDVVVRDVGDAQAALGRVFSADEDRPVIERDASVEPRHECSEAFRKTLAAHEGERAEAEPVQIQFWPSVLRQCRPVAVDFREQGARGFGAVFGLKQQR